VDQTREHGRHQAESAKEETLIYRQGRQEKTRNQQKQGTYESVTSRTHGSLSTQELLSIVPVFLGVPLMGVLKRILGGLGG
jgi:predicted phage tail protein